MRFFAADDGSVRKRDSTIGADQICSDRKLDSIWNGKSGSGRKMMSSDVFWFGNDLLGKDLV